jgi:ubiquinone/menaquinone biosynthesis C-methylase UbiE
METNTNKSVWQTQELSDSFLNGVRGAIPGAELQLTVLRKTAKFFVPEPRRILDLGCGDGILGRLLLETFPETSVVFADFSDPMLEAARARLGENSRAQIVRVDFSSPEWVNQIPKGVPFDIVVSGFAIHHQLDERKKEIYSEIFRILSPGGIFLNHEHVLSSSPAGEQLFDEFFVDQLHRFHATSGDQKSLSEVMETYYNRPDKKENILSPVDLQCRWLQEIGFHDVDCFFKIFELTIFGGRKSS